MTKYVYLCGPIRGLSVGQATAWRDDFVEMSSPTALCLDPTRDHEFVIDPSGVIVGPKQTPIARSSALVSRDLADVKRSSLLVANFTHSTANIGSLIEIGYAHALGIPIVLILNPEDTPLQNHPFLAHIPIATFHTVEGAADFVRQFIGD